MQYGTGWSTYSNAWDLPSCENLNGATLLTGMVKGATNRTPVIATADEGEPTPDKKAAGTGVCKVGGVTYPVLVHYSCDGNLAVELPAQANGQPVTWLTYTLLFST